MRHDIDPWYDAGVSAEYVVNQSELVWLDPYLARADSVEFYRAASDCLARGRGPTSADVSKRTCTSYAGRFAPEFEYDEWAMSWRDRVHATYLHLVHATAQKFAADGRYEDAFEVLQQATEIDDEALELETALVWVYERLGSHGAAVEQYRRLAAAYRRDLGIDPPPLQEVLGAAPFD